MDSLRLERFRNLGEIFPPLASKDRRLLDGEIKLGRDLARSRSRSDSSPPGEIWRGIAAEYGVREARQF